MARWDRGLCSSPVARVGAACAVAAIVLVTNGGPASAETPPVPDSACATESSFRSTAGDHTASLLIINNTSETLQSLWLDYEGKRVFYEQIPPLTSYVQPTFLTHPWIIANLAGTCYRFLVMNSPQQTVTVDPGDGPPAVTASPPGVTATLPTTTSTAPHNVTPPTSSSVPARPVTVSTPTKDNGPSVPLILAGAAAAVAAAAAAAAAWWAAHNLAAKKAAQQKAEDDEAERVMNEVNAELDKMGQGPKESNSDDADDDPDYEPPDPRDLAPDDPGTGTA